MNADSYCIEAGPPHARESRPTNNKTDSKYKNKQQIQKQTSKYKDKQANTKTN
jgi:hypothetical protein